MAEVLTPMRRQILEYIMDCQRERNFPPTIREIGDHVGLSSPATVATHINVLRAAGYIEKNPQQPRTLVVHLDTEPTARDQRNRVVPLVGDVAAGTGVLASETSHELMSIPEQFVGRGDCFMLEVRGESMIGAGIMPGDFVIVEKRQEARTGEIVLVGIPGDEATIKRFFPQGSRVVLQPENPTMEPLDFDAADVTVYGKVVSVLRRY